MSDNNDGWLDEINEKASDGLVVDRTGEDTYRLIRNGEVISTGNLSREDVEKNVRRLSR